MKVKKEHIFSGRWNIRQVKTLLFDHTREIGVATQIHGEARSLSTPDTAYPHNRGGGEVATIHGELLSSLTLEFILQPSSSTLTNQTQLGSVISAKLRVEALSQEIPPCYGIRNIITAFYLTLPTSAILSHTHPAHTPALHPNKQHFIIIFPPMPRSSNRLFSLIFFHQTHYVFLHDSLRAACPTHLIHPPWSNGPTNIWQTVLTWRTSLPSLCNRELQELYISRNVIIVPLTITNFSQGKLRQRILFNRGGTRGSLFLKGTPFLWLEIRRLQHPRIIHNCGRHYSKEYQITRALEKVAAWMVAGGEEGGGGPGGGANLMCLWLNNSLI
jgi:hypothetical protein